MNDKSNDLVVRFHWMEGSVPPPHHYEYTITLGPGARGQIDYQPDYAFEGVPVWREEFSLDKGALEKLYELMVKTDVFTRRWQSVEDSAVGGSLQWLDVHYRGEDYAVPSRVQETEELDTLYRAIRACVQNALWSSLRARREKYVDESDKN